MRSVPNNNLVSGGVPCGAANTELTVLPPFQPMIGCKKGVMTCMLLLSDCGSRKESANLHAQGEDTQSSEYTDGFGMHKPPGPVPACSTSKWLNTQEQANDLACILHSQAICTALVPCC